MIKPYSQSSDICLSYFSLIQVKSNTVSIQNSIKILYNQTDNEQKLQHQ